MAREVRKDLVRMHQRGTGLGSSLSCVEILLSLYFEVMQIADPTDPARDRFILSKGHAASALYAVLARRGFLDAALLPGYLTDGSVLTAHPSRGAVPGVEASTGSLGHGLAIGLGMALAARRNDARYRVFVLLGDGELQEGAVWEAVSLAPALGLDNLVAVIDANGLQGYGRVDDLSPRSSFVARLRAFGWQAEELDGHDIPALSARLAKVPFESGRPSAVVARTVKGRGVAEMEDTLGWHYFSVPAGRVEAFLSELDGGGR